MTHGALEPLSTETERLLREERSYPPESAELRARSVSRARGAFRDAAGARAGSFWWRRTSFLLAAALVTASAAAAIAVWRSLPRPDRPLGVLPPESGAPKVLERAQASPVPASEPPRPRENADTEPAVRARGSVVPAPRPPVSGDAGALELGLLKRARAAVASKNFAAALDAVAEHQRRFPAGRLREEREALRIKALSGLGRNDEARLFARRFRERFPESVLAPRLEETSRSEP